MKCIMKHTKKTLAALGLALGWLTGSLQAQSAVVVREWPFSSNANPAGPEVTSSNFEEARATVQQGQFASGWFEQDSMLGTEKGIWDLGRKGTVTLSKWSDQTGPATASHEITVRVTQWYDGGIYGTLATVDVPGARLANRSQAYLMSGSIGNWVTDETHWMIDVGASADSVVVTSPGNGALIDKVSLETPIPIVVPPTLSIQSAVKGSNSVEVSWPVAGTLGWQLEANPRLEQSKGWAPVGGQPQVIGDHLVVTMQKEGTLFFRLRHP
ncbi:MAG: hypothetical protein JWM16_2438 [Verrucomicrobiales bacterium]|nr:hypothetical protein [Verrucomicrobiales bacterium]